MGARSSSGSSQPPPVRATATTTTIMQFSEEEVKACVDAGKVKGGGGSGFVAGRGTAGVKRATSMLPCASMGAPLQAKNAAFPRLSLSFGAEAERRPRAAFPTLPIPPVLAPP